MPSDPSPAPRPPPPQAAVPAQDGAAAGQRGEGAREGAGDPRHVTILLCTLNGARFLPAQLDSYLRQTHSTWSLWISDDGSADATPALLAAFRRDHADRDIRILRGPGRGSAANFLSLLCHPDLPPGLVALSDQDDIWLPGKLARALRQLAAAQDGLAQDGADAAPLIYSAQSFYIDDQGRRRGGSRPPPGAPVFANAMLQNVLAGHSMVLNAAALALVRRAGVPAATAAGAGGGGTGVAFHDWWLTLLVTAAGGRAVLDRRRVVLYRQHGSNVLGAPGGVRAGLLRAARVLGHDYGDWVAANARALQAAGPLLDPANRKAVEAFLAAPRRPGPGRVALLRRLGLHRQGRIGAALACFAAVLGRL